MKFWSENLRRRVYSEDLGIDGRMALREIGWEGVD
jgi:hypothetical protein